MPRKKDDTLVLSESCRLWTEFFAVNPSLEVQRRDPDYYDTEIMAASDLVYVSFHLNQVVPQLSVPMNVLELFMEWAGLTRKEALKHVAYIDTPEWIGPGIYEVAGSLPSRWERSCDSGRILPFSKTRCPKVLEGCYAKVRSYGWNYFMSTEGDSCLKIGYCFIAPQQRLAMLQTGSTRRLTLVEAYPNNRCVVKKIERFMHRVLKRYRRGKSEWFDVDLLTTQQVLAIAWDQWDNPYYFGDARKPFEDDEEENERRAQFFNEHPWEIGGRHEDSDD